MVSENDSAFDRGRIPAHHMWQVRESLETLVLMHQRNADRRKRLLRAGAPLSCSLLVLGRQLNKQ